MEYGPPMGDLTLVLGGIRSGKSAFAERIAAVAARRVLYFATGEGGDDEMQERIRRHRERRPSGWTTMEAPLDPAGALRSAGGGWDAVLLDSISGWLSNLVLSSDPGIQRIPAAGPGSLDAVITAGIADLVAWQRSSGTSMVMVSDEVGLSLVSPNPLGRQYQDLLGAANQRLAAEASDVFLVAAGLPLRLKGRDLRPPRARTGFGHDPDRG